MKVTVNFLPPRLPLLAIMSGLALVTALAGVSLAGWLMFDSVQLRAQIPALEQRLASLQQQSKNVRTTAELPDEHALNDLRRRVSALNRYSVATGWSAPTLLAWLERHLPDDVYLAGIQQNLELGTVKLTAESADATALTLLLGRLEKEPHYREILLVRQGPRAGRVDRMQFVIELKERR
ncbi:MAG: PilN domain-containing protein [Pseudomonadota bacterium]